jgi:hypothetical protein
VGDKGEKKEGVGVVGHRVELCELKALDSLFRCPWGNVGSLWLEPSASSLPVIPVWPGAQRALTLKASMVSCIRRKARCDD